MNRSTQNCNTTLKLCQLGFGSQIFGTTLSTLGMQGAYKQRKRPWLPVMPMSLHVRCDRGVQ
eukprot:1405674-Amphidinium_carterae.1